MKKVKIYDGVLVEIYLKSGNNEIGYEAEAAMDVMVGGLVGAKTFASHLKDPIPYWADFAETVMDFMDKTETEIRDSLKAEEPKQIR